MNFPLLIKLLSIRKQILILENNDFRPQWLAILFVSFQFVSCRFDLFRFDLFRFVSICFVLFRSVSFRFVSFRFDSFRFDLFRSVSFLFRFALYRSPHVSATRVWLMPVSHYGELILRVYYEYWRVITRQKIREFTVISYDCDISVTSARVLLDISTRCVR